MGVIDRFRGAFRPRAALPADDAASARDEALRLITEGNAFEDSGDAASALQRYDAAIAQAPELARAFLNRGNALLAMGDVEGAIAAYSSAQAKDPQHAGAYFNLGNARARLGEREAALEAYAKALAVNAEFVDAEVARGNMLEELGRFEEAVASYRRAVRLKPDFAEVHHNLGYPLRKLGRVAEAEASFRRAIELRPDYAQAHYRLGNILEEQLRPLEAEACYRRALELRPDFATAHSTLLFCLSHDAAVDAPTLFAEHCRFGERFEASLKGAWPQHANDRDPARRLEVGFVSGDLRDHAVAQFVEPILEHLSASSMLSLHAYYNHDDEDAVTHRLRARFGHWHPVADLTDEALARRIIDDRIDILIDLSGHTSHHRLLTFARKPAPVQASWIGYPGTTGLRSMDYYICDPQFLPRAQFESYFTERLAQLPANAPFMPRADAPPINELPALARGYVTFGSFNRPSKLTRSVIALWAKLLRELPQARMLLGAMPHAGEHEAVAAAFTAEGVDRDRLLYRSRCDVPSYLRLHHEVDICLDTFPYTGGTTTNYALWMGVPTLTLAGQTPPGRQGAAILGHLGLQEFVASSADEFVATGVRWASDPASLSGLRARLRQRYEGSPMRRPDVIAAGLERALRAMWQRWCAGLPPDSIDVSSTG